MNSEEVVMKKEFCLVILAIVFSILLFSHASAKVAFFFGGNNSTTNSTNWSTSAIFNVTFINGTDFMIPDNASSPFNRINATFWYNTTHGQGANGNLTLIGNSSVCAVVDATNSVFACWANLSITGLTDGLYNITAIIRNQSGATINVTNSTFASHVLFDSTAPQVVAANISSPVQDVNYSDYKNGLLLLNVSVYDAGIGTGSVLFNITNAAGAQQSLVTASNAAGDAWNATINTSSLTDGRYNVTVYASDTQLGNTNNSARIDHLTFDNTKPVITFSCTPFNMDVGAALSCPCSIADSLSGYNSSSLITSTPSTSVAGSFSATCQANDYAGNLQTASFGITVKATDSTSGNSGGGGGSTPAVTVWISTQQILDSQLQSGFRKNYGERYKVQFDIAGTSHSVGVKKITTTTVTITVASTPQDVDMTVGSVKKFDLDGNGYYDTQVTFNGLIAGKADISILKINEAVPASAPVTGNDVSGSQDNNQPAGNDQGTTGSSLLGSKIFWVVIAVIVIVIIVVLFLIKSQSKGNKRKNYGF